MEKRLVLSVIAVFFGFLGLFLLSVDSQSFTGAYYVDTHYDYPYVEKTVLGQPCDDTDGANFFKQGWVFNGKAKFTDVCVVGELTTQKSFAAMQESNTLIEYVCDDSGEIGSLTVTCPNGCVKGTCYPEVRPAF